MVSPPYSVRGIYCKIPCIRPPFDAKKLMPKKGGGLIHEDWTFDIIDQQYYKQSIKGVWDQSRNWDKMEKSCLRRVHL